ncbi:MAG TPA: hypothetical protein VN581_08180 [Patescibacteria group bacterium]|nr:hypothetical protein [Patescibacteria group bacterium]
MPHSGLRTGLVLALFAGSAVAGDATWTSTGPLGGRVHEIVFDPTTPSKAYATTLGGVFRSVDGGATWTAADAGIVADTIYPLPLMLDAEQPAKLYTFDSWARIYRSDNSGTNWVILPDTLPSDVHPSTLVDKPGLACVLLLGTGTNAPGRGSMLFKSTDCGLSLFQIGAGLPADVAVEAIAFDPADATHNTLLVGIAGDSSAEGDAIWISTDGGLNFVASTSNFSPGSGYRAAVNALSFGTSGHVWAIIDHYSVAHSSDAGENWTIVSAAPGYVTVVADPTVPARAWAGGTNPDDQVIRIDFDGSLYSTTTYNDGLTGNASYVRLGREVPAGVARLAWRGGATPQLFATTEGSGVFALTDGGTPTWNLVAQSPAGAAIRALALHPMQPQTLWAGQATFSISSPALFRSNDGGSTWAPSNNGLDAADIQAIAIDPTTTTTVATTTLYAGGRSTNNISDNFKNNGIYRSDDGGTTWTTIDGDIPAITNRNLGAVRDIEIDPNACVAPPCGAGEGPLTRLYVAGHGRNQADATAADDTHRLLLSNDRGATWIDLSGNPGFPRSNRDVSLRQRVTPTVVVVAPDDPQVLYVGTEAEFYDYDSGDLIDLDPARESGLFKSTDGGANWTRVAGLPTKIDTAIYPNASLDVVDLLIDPRDSDVLWIALRDLFSSGTSTIYRSDDGGSTWSKFDSGIAGSLELNDLAFDPQNPDILYASAGGNGANPGAVYRGVVTLDDDEVDIQWLSISIGLPAESAYTIAVDPNDANQLHAGTDTGVFSITRQPDQDGDGIPDAIEDAAPDAGGLPFGDGNGDLTPDSVQRDVGTIGVSIRRPFGTPATGAVTTEVVSATGDVDCVAGIPQTVDVQALNQIDVGLDPSGIEQQPYYRHADGINALEVLGCSSGRIRIRFHGADFSGPQWSYRVFAPLESGSAQDIGWFDFSNQSVRVDVDTWEVDFTADAFGSYRPEVDSIRFIGGPACLDPTLFIDSFETAPSPSTTQCPTATEVTP